MRVGLFVFYYSVCERCGNGGGLPGDFVLEVLSVHAVQVWGWVCRRHDECVMLSVL